MTFPKSQGYASTVPVVWSITPNTQNITKITLSCTYVSGYFNYLSPLPIYVFNLTKVAATGSFNLLPLTVNPPDADITSWTGSPLPMYDGSYTVRMTYFRGDGVSFNSPTASISTTTITLPPRITSPVAGSAYARYVNLTYTLPTPARFSGYPVTVTISNDTGVLYIASLASTPSLSFTYDQNDLTNVSGSFVRNYTIPEGGSTVLADGTYNFTLCYIDQLNHPENCTSVPGVNLIQLSSPIVISYPRSDMTTVYSTATGIVINYTIPAVITPDSLRLHILPSNVVLSDMDDGPFELFSYEIPDTDTRITDGMATFAMSYIETNLSTTLTTTVMALIQRNTPPAVIYLPMNNTRVVWTSNSMTQSMTFGLPSLPSPGSVYLSFYEDDRLTPSLVIDMSDAVVDDDDLSFDFTFTWRPVLELPTGMNLVAGEQLDDGEYRISITYKDYLDNPAATSNIVYGYVVTSITLDPVLTGPINGTYVSQHRPMILRFTLAEDAYDGSVRAIFESTTDETRQITLSMVNTTAGDYEYVIDPSDLVFGHDTWIHSISFSWDIDDTSVLPNDVYRYHVQCTDWERNPVSVSETRLIVVRTSTSPPVISADSSLNQSNIVQELPLNLSYTLVDDARSIQFLFTKTGPLVASASPLHVLTRLKDTVATNLTVFASTLLTAGAHSLLFPDDIILGIYSIYPTNTLDSGIYDVVIVVFDLADNMATTQVSDIAITVNVTSGNQTIIIETTTTVETSSDSFYGLWWVYWFVILILCSVLLGVILVLLARLVWKRCKHHEYGPI